MQAKPPCSGPASTSEMAIYEALYEAGTPEFDQILEMVR